MIQEIDLDAYFSRIGYTGAGAPTLDTLRALHVRHPEAIAFENLNPLLGWPVRLDAAALQQKLVKDGRGGYCFEQNLLFGRALRMLGFSVTGLAARVLWNQPEDAITARTHMLLRVEIEGQSWIADVGFGGQTLTGPLRLEPDIVQETPHEPFRLALADGYFKMQSRVGDAWRTLCRFDLQEQFDVDFEIANYYLSTHPASRFRTNLIASRSAPGRRYVLLNDGLSIHHLNGTSEQRILTTPAEVIEVLQSAFRLTLPKGPELEFHLSASGRGRPRASGGG